MRHVFRSLCITVLTLLVTPPLAMSYVNHGGNSWAEDKGIFVGQKVIRHDLDQTSKQHGLITGEFSTVKSLSTPATLEDFVQTSLQFITDHSDFFGQVESVDVTLDKTSVLMNKSEQFFKFRVSRDGIRIEDAHIDFRYKFGTLVQVVNYSYHMADSDLRQPIKNLSSSLKVKLGVKDLTHVEQVYRAVPKDQGYVLIKVDVFATERNGMDYQAQVVSATGEIYQLKPMEHYFEGRAHGQVFGRYYKDPLMDGAFPWLNLTSNNGTVTADGNGVFNANSGSGPRVSGLRGAYLSVRPTTGSPISGNAIESGGAFDLNLLKDPSTQNHSDKAMSQSMVYYHVNLIIAEAKKLIQNSWLNSTLTANVNLSSTCNAHWDGATINFYSADSSCANTGSISDVVYHEWGHGLDDAFGGIEDGAFSEGFGDIMSLAMTGSNILGPGFKLNGGAVRDLEPDKKYPQDRGEVHAEGLIIGGAMYDLYKALIAKHGETNARQILKNYSFKMITTSSTYLEVYDALLAIDDNDASLDNASPNACEINKAFAAHGLARLDASLCENLPPPPPPVPSGDIGDLLFNEFEGNPNGVLEPGDGVSLYTTYKNTGSNSITSLQARGVVSPPVAGITISDDSLVWDTVAAGETKMTRNSIALYIGADVPCGQTFTLKFDIQSSGGVSSSSRNMTVLCLADEE